MSQHAVVVLSVLMGHACCGAAGDQASGGSTEAERAAMLDALLRPIIGDLARDIKPVRATSLSEGVWRVTATAQEGNAPPVAVAITLDYERRYVCSLTGLVLAEAGRREPDSQREAASAFAKDHLGPWTDQTQFTGITESGGWLLVYTWANTPAEGTWTGDWWGVVVDTTRQAIIGFYQQRAYREVGMDEVKVTREEAVGKVQALYRDPLGANAPTISVTDTKLILSSRFSPDHGPVWMVSVLANAEPMTHIVDAKTGELLALPGQQQGQGG